MTLNLIKPTILFRPFSITSHCYCDNKSIYQRDEEGKQPRAVHGKLYPDWRQPWIERKGEWSSKLAVFLQSNPNPNLVKTLQSIPDLNMKVIRNWWGTMKEIHAVQNQKYISERVEILGSNLAATHFFTYRGASVRLQYSKEWIVGNPMVLNLPTFFEKGYIVEAIDCSNFTHGGLRYEGVANLMDLTSLKWLSLKNNAHINVWALDRIAGLNGQSLEYLDISGCNFTVECIHALARMINLKILVVTDPGGNFDLQMGLSQLEQHNSKLLIKLD